MDEFRLQYRKKSKESRVVDGQHLDHQLAMEKEVQILNEHDH